MSQDTKKKYDCDGYKRIAEATRRLNITLKKNITDELSTEKVYFYDYFTKRFLDYDENKYGLIDIPVKKNKYPKQSCNKW